MTCPLCLRVKNTQQNNYPYLIHEFKNSYLFLGEHQFYRGYSVLVTKDHFREMTDMPMQLRNEFFSEMMISHEVLQKEFNPKKMNMCSLGNVVDHIHWHFFPRYSDDPSFNNPPWLQMHLFENAKISAHQRGEIIEKLKNAFSNVGL